MTMNFSVLYLCVTCPAFIVTLILIFVWLLRHSNGIHIFAGLDDRESMKGYSALISRINSRHQSFIKYDKYSCT